jgi:RNA ligase (TIGR02306 family)
MRQLVTIRTVSEILPIEGADRIVLAKIDGWQCVVKKGDFKVGDVGVYFEIDSLVPGDDPRFTFLTKGKVQDYARVKTIRLKGQLSQGLLLSLKDFPEVVAYCVGSSMVRDTLGVDLAEQNLTDLLKVKKYEPAVPIGGKQSGTFPTHIVRKTDQERIQNMTGILSEPREYEVTEKLDGCSCTMWFYPKSSMSYVGVASRNWEMQKDDENVYAQMLRKYDLIRKLIEMGRNIAIQGEIIGPSIQGNKYQLAQQEFFVYDIWDIDAQKYLGAQERNQIVAQFQLNHVPIITLDKFPTTVDEALAIADGRSRLNQVMREGLVFKALDGSVSFKAISNKWLLENE